MLTQDEIVNAADQIGRITVTLQPGEFSYSDDITDIPPPLVEPKALHPEVISLYHVSHTLRYVS
jgi:hypothetical protein